MLAKYSLMHIMACMDAKTVCEKLYEHYGSDASVGEVTGVAQSTINRLRRGVTSPMYDTYELLRKHLDQIQEEVA